MTKLMKVFVAWIIMSTCYTLPIASILDELKIWFKVWLIMIAVMALMACGLWLLGVR